jgi:hypothetical protein
MTWKRSSEREKIETGIKRVRRSIQFPQASSIFPCPAKLVNIAVRLIVTRQAAAGIGSTRRRYIHSNPQSILIMLIHAESSTDAGELKI